MRVVRRALPGDAEEVLRLRQVMIDSVFASDPSVARHGESLPTPRAEPGEPDGDFTAFVVDRPERPGATACVVAGAIDHRVGKAAGAAVRLVRFPPRARPFAGARALSA
ncbi:MULTISPECIES: hypothetical protein [unclassified Streptomyces]|uniref:hypothetical protein n=1 Tax=unclassified Streptomyces TaxID=2593676 RepID=UPI0027D32D0D|nr:MULTISPECIES: hypothetical protein [unclassified Streptomyces]WMD08500.1 hypothetical protein Q7C01_30800 [Streptomyces sp. FXY-T5]